MRTLNVVTLFNQTTMVEWYTATLIKALTKTMRFVIIMNFQSLNF